MFKRCPRSVSLLKVPLGQFGDTTFFSTCVSPARCLLHVVKLCTTRVEPRFFTFSRGGLFVSSCRVCLSSCGSTSVITCRRPSCFLVVSGHRKMVPFGIFERRNPKNGHPICALFPQFAAFFGVRKNMAT